MCTLSPLFVLKEDNFNIELRYNGANSQNKYKYCVIKMMNCNVQEVEEIL